MWPEAVERVARELRAAAIDAMIQEFPEGAGTPEAAATAIGCPLDEVVKISVFVCDGKPVVVLVPGDHTPDEARVASSVEAGEIRAAAAAEIAAATGFGPHAVAPFPLPAGLRVLIERTLFQQPRAWICAGSPTHMASLSTAELLRLSGAETADLLGPRYSSTTDR